MAVPDFRDRIGLEYWKRCPRRHEDDRYFNEQVLRKRPYIDRAWCAQVVAEPIRHDTRPTGRLYWGATVEEDGRYCFAPAP
mgnify:CR=1 FL=1